MADSYITLAIHTYDLAVALRDTLVDNGVPAQLENVNINNPSPACGVRVRVPEQMLPLALKIVEADARTSESRAHLKEEEKRILVPVDLSQVSMNLIKVAFTFAAELRWRPVLLNVFATPYFDGSLSVTDNFVLDIRDTEVRKNLADTSRTKMDRFKARIAEEIAAGNIPPVAFDTLVREGLPEDVILEYSRSTPPALIVMSTRGVEQKAAQLVGSVTAEVLDSCRVPVFTVPHTFEFNGFSSLSNALFLCNVDQHDLLAMDVFVRLCGKSAPSVTLVPVSDKAGSRLPGRMADLTRYFSEHYPELSFSHLLSFPDELRRAISAAAGVTLLVVPNKKKNIFARLINPGIAHKVIFEADVPMFALPV